MVFKITITIESMVVHHWSSDGMVMYHRWSLVLIISWSYIFFQHNLISKTHPSPSSPSSQNPLFSSTRFPHAPPRSGSISALRASTWKSSPQEMSFHWIQMVPARNNHDLIRNQHNSQPHPHHMIPKIFWNSKHSLKPFNYPRFEQLSIIQGLINYQLSINQDLSNQRSDHLSIIN